MPINHIRLKNQGITYEMRYSELLVITDTSGEEVMLEKADREYLLDLLTHFEFILGLLDHFKQEPEL